MTSSSSISGAGRPAAISAVALGEQQGQQGRPLLALRAEAPQRPAGRAHLDLVELRAVGGVGAAQLGVPAALPSSATIAARVRLGARAGSGARRSPSPSARPPRARAPASASDGLGAGLDQRHGLGGEPLVPGRERAGVAWPALTREASALRWARVRPKRLRRSARAGPERADDAVQVRAGGAPAGP